MLGIINVMTGRLYFLPTVGEAIPLPQRIGQPCIPNLGLIYRYRWTIPVGEKVREVDVLRINHSTMIAQTHESKGGRKGAVTLGMVERLRGNLWDHPASAPFQT
ncbi:hypothetical protein GCM10018966_101810 [Streptomyces yanii]